MVCAITVVEHGEQIGGLLRSAREAAGLEVDDVVFRTRIPRSVVESLEAEDFTAFTSPVYAKSFLAQYSGFLHVDAQPWLSALEPGCFMPAASLRTLVEGPETQAGENASMPEHRGGTLSVMGLLMLSSALVVGAIKGYEFFEVRLGGESNVPVPEVHDSLPISAKPLEVKPPAEPGVGEFEPPSPRAIIVR